MATAFDVALPFNGQSSFEDGWRSIFGRWFQDAVIAGRAGELQVFGDSTGRQVKVNAGAVRVDGEEAENVAQKTLALTTNTSGNPRIDRLVARLTYGNPSTMALDIKAGTPASSPSPPALTQNSSIREVSLAQVGPLINNYSTIALGDVHDERFFASAYSKPAAADVAARDLWIPSPFEGAEVFARSNGQVWLRSGGTWLRTRKDIDWNTYVLPSATEQTTSSLTSWPNGLAKSVTVPPWANNARLYCKIGCASALVSSGGNSDTFVHMRLGTIQSAIERVQWPNNATPHDLVMTDVIGVSTIAGTTVNLRLLAQDNNVNGHLFVDAFGVHYIEAQYF